LIINVIDDIGMNEWSVNHEGFVLDFGA